MGLSHPPVSAPNCPHCRVSNAVRLARRSGLDKTISLLRVFPFRCDACGLHFYRFLLAKSA